MLIGDSFAAGYGVEIDSIFAKIIEKKINKKVLNFGVSGSDPNEHISKYINDGSKFNFDGWNANLLFISYARIVLCV